MSFRRRMGFYGAALVALSTGVATDVSQKTASNRQFLDDVPDLNLTYGDLKLAREKEAYRQSFFNLFYQQSRIQEYCSGILYDPQLKAFQEDMKSLEKKYSFRSLAVNSPEETLCCVPNALEIVGRMEKLPIYVTSALFQNKDPDSADFLVKTIDDVVSLVIKHEYEGHLVSIFRGYRIGTRTLDHRDSKRIRNRRFVERLDEARASLTQLRQVTPRVSKSVIRAAKTNAEVAIGDMITYRDRRQYPDVADIAEEQLSQWTGLISLSEIPGTNPRVVLTFLNR